VVGRRAAKAVKAVPAVSKVARAEAKRVDKAAPVIAKAAPVAARMVAKALEPSTSESPKHGCFALQMHEGPGVVVPGPFGHRNLPNHSHGPATHSSSSRWPAATAA
jgi:hypothetical protein